MLVDYYHYVDITLPQEILFIIYFDNRILRLNYSYLSRLATCKPPSYIMSLNYCRKWLMEIHGVQVFI